MTSERWRQIEELYHAAQDRRPGERVAFLSRACQGDEELKREIETLLAKDSLDHMLDRPASELLTESVAERLAAGADAKGLSAGDQLGPYEIVARIGAGGMGTVYKARDKRVDRVVAIKVSEGQFSGRFEREARAIAAFNHPHICTLYDVGPNYLVMEYVEGRPLRGPLPLDEVLRLSVQILDALEAAQRVGMVHRDLKPANILVTKSGVKVLDFGLAKMETSVTADPETLTQRGAIIGTLRYMSPEQVQGKELDARSDLFSFGLLLYEMLTGRRAFEAENSATVIAAILERDPPNVEAIEPAGLQRILRRCLAKDPANRWQSAADLKAALEWLPSLTAAQPTAGGARRPATWGWTAALLLTGLAAGWFIGWPGIPSRQPVLEFSIAPPDGTSFADPSVGPVGYLSPDGRMLLGVIWTRTGFSIWLRSLDSQVFQPVPQTEGVITSAVAWSPDSRNIAFVTRTGRLTTIPVASGPPRVLSDGVYWGPIAWGEDGNLIATDLETRRLTLIPSSGGSRRLLGELDATRGEISHVRPQFLPGTGKYIYYAICRNQGQNGTYATTLDTAGNGARVAILPSASAAVYVPMRERRWFRKARGWLLTGDNSRLYAREFDPAGLRVAGEVVQIADHVAWGNNGVATALSASNGGMLAVNPPIRMEAAPSIWTRDGQSVVPPFPPGSYFTPSFSHDGQRVALAMTPSGSLDQDIWIFDLNGSTLSRVTSGFRWQAFPVWSPDDRTLLFVRTDSNNDGRTLYRQDVDGLGRPAKLSPPLLLASPCGLSADGRTLLYSASGHADMGNGSLWTMPVDRAQDAKQVLEAEVRFARFSPDNRFVVFSSRASGTSEIYIQTAAAPVAQRWRVSPHGGTQPLWSRDGKEIFYLSSDGKLMAAPVRIRENTAELGVPKALFTLPPLPATFSGYQYDVSPKGDRFLFLTATGGGHVPPVRIIQNWESLLSR